MNVSLVKTLHMIIAILAFATLAWRATLSQEHTTPVPLATGEDLPDGSSRANIKDDDGDISIDALDEIDIESIGILDEGSGGFGADMWRGSERAQVEELLSQLPTAVRSRATHELMKTLLLSSATAPVKNQESSDLLEIRLTALADLGEFESFFELLAIIPESATTPKIKQLKSNVLFLMGNIAAGCELILNQVQEADSLYWQKALFICQLLRDEKAAALSLSLLRDQLNETDADFLELGGVSLGEVPNLTTTLAPNVLNFALLLNTEIGIPDHWLTQAGPAIQRAIAEAETILLTTRLVAAEHAAEMGALSANYVRRLYQLVKFNNEEFDDAIATAQKNGGALGRALLHQASIQKQWGDERATLLLASWQNSRATGSAILSALVNKKPLLTLHANDQIIHAAPEIVRALLAIGNDADSKVIRIKLIDGTETLISVTERFESWLDLLGESAEMDTEIERTLASLMPLVTIANLDTKPQWHPRMAERWWNAFPDEIGSPAQVDRGNRLFMTLNALGYPVGQKGWNLLLNGPNMVTTQVPSVGIRYSMQDAAKSGQIGSTVLFALLALGEGGPVEASPLALGSVLRCLRQIGLENHARAIALEAVIENGM
ncbi:MAG: hypothetical protein VCB14_03555 [Alphaproteobacteria bacterium]|nr:hypothetical protein [Alphaproteobacteria bacterium]